MNGFLQNSKGEHSHTKLINIIVALCIMVGWTIVSGLQHKLVDIPPTLLGILFFCMGINSVNKNIESKIPKFEKRKEEKRNETIEL